MALMRIIRLTLWDAQHPMVFGPFIEVIANNIEAVQFNWDTYASTERAIVYLRGGTRLSVMQTVSQVWEIAQGAFDPRTSTDTASILRPGMPHET